MLGSRWFTAALFLTSCMADSSLFMMQLSTHVRRSEQRHRGSIQEPHSFKKNYTWRQNLVNVMQTTELNDGDIYEFGVFNGDSMAELQSLMPQRFLWGFDSFEGLPETVDDVQQKDFQAGEYNATKTPEEIEARLGGSKHASFIKGFFSESLTAGLAEQMRMRPAAYVDIDVDIYSASFEALDWMFAQNLIQPGTIVGYDDWWVNPCSRGGEELFPLDTSEGKAHKEISQKYKVHFQCLIGSCKDPTVQGRDSWGPIFKVVAFGGHTRPQHGFELSHNQVKHFKNSNDRCIFHYSSGPWEVESR